MTGDVPDIAGNRDSEPEHGHDPRGNPAPERPAVGQRDEQRQLANRDEHVNLRREGGCPDAVQSVVLSPQEQAAVGLAE